MILYKIIKQTYIFPVTFLLFVFFQNCTVKYSFSGASIPPGLKTASIQFIPIRDPLAPGNINQRLTDKLRDKIENQTKLISVQGLGDVDFEAEITKYSTEATTITSGETAAQNRLTIGVRVKYTNNADAALDYDKTFTRYVDYPSSNQVNETLEDGILDLIVQDIFNASFVNW